ncbi:hypothetical protein GF386_05555 [Candidatus Pacearchaeota archaeon]|nr:hypothetical protein [Candidatus Pacearchaeota archaeon]MBD3283566.1 hypothetical protein [Candidatus Pacearchaeota archaeon]
MLKHMIIDELQPTESTLNPETMSYYGSTFPLLREDVQPPGVWTINGIHYIADGNNQTFDRYTTRGIPNICANVLTPETCGVGPDVYSMVVEEILKKAEQAREKGVTHISHLRFPDS